MAKFYVMSNLKRSLAFLSPGYTLATLTAIEADLIQHLSVLEQRHLGIFDVTSPILKPFYMGLSRSFTVYFSLFRPGTCRELGVYRALARTKSP